MLYDDKFYSIPQKINILDITPEQAIKIIEDHKKKLEKNIVKTFKNNPDLKIVKKRNKLQILYKNKYYNIPDDVDIEKLTEKQALEIVKAQSKK